MPRLLKAFFEPENYQIVLDVNRETKQIHGQVTIQGQAKSQEVYFHAKDLTITDSNFPYQVDNDAEEITVQLGQVGDVEVTFTYEATLTDNMVGIYPSYYEHEGIKKQLIGTQFETHFARQAFPSIDEPAAKATFDLAVSFDEKPGELILSNMPEVSNDNGLHRFERTLKMSTYLLAFVFGDMQAAYATTKNGTKVGVFSTRAHKPEALDFPLDIAVRVTDFYEDYFGVPYPLQHAWHIALPDFSAGAMENWGAITYREVALVPDPDNSSFAAKQNAALVIAHELAHQWFGNLVTMEWWDDLWLNESFANMMEYVAIDAIEPEWHIMHEYAIQEPFLALNRDATDGVQSVHIAVETAEEASTIFDGAIVYAKGSRLMTMLRKWLGDQVFREGLGIYFERHQYGNTIGRNLWDAMSEASGRDVAGFMDAWLEQAGYPVVEVVVEDDTLVLRQQQFFVGPSEDKGRLYPVPLNSNWQGLPEIMDQAELRIPNYAALKEQNMDQALRLNQDNAAHYIIHYSDELFVDIVLDLPELTPIDRLQLLQDKRMLAQGGRIEFADLVRVLNYFKGDTAFIVNHGLAQIFTVLDKFIDDDAHLEAAYKVLIAKTFDDAYMQVGWDKQADESPEVERLRSLVVSREIGADNPHATKKARTFFKNYQDRPWDLPAPIRASVLKDTMENQETDQLVDQLFESYVASSDANYKRELGMVLSSSKQDATIARVIEAYKDATIIKPQDHRFWWFEILKRHSTQMQAVEWLINNWDWLEATLGGDMSFFQYITEAGKNIRTVEAQQLFVDFFSPKKAVPALKRHITMAENNIIATLDLLASQKERTQAAIELASETKG